MSSTAGRPACRSALRAAVIVLLTCALASCGVSAGDQLPAGGSGRTTTGSPTESGPAAEDEVQKLGEESLALVETPFATGSAVLLEGGYLVTNAHVVDPFDVVDLRFADGDEELGVPVTGVDLTADLAVLGPIETSRVGLEHADPEGLASGDPVHLIGFPGEQDDPHVVVETGTYVRHQYPEDWDLDYLQANVDIGEGQSGGALVDAAGRLLGISALEATEGVALSLSVTDVDERVAQLRTGSADGAAGDWTPVSDAQGSLRHTVEIDGPADVHTFFVSGAAFADELVVHVSDPNARVAVMDPALYPIAANDAAIEAGEDGDGIWSLSAPDDELEVLEQEADGSFSLELEEGVDQVVLVGSAEPRPGVEVTTSPGSVEIDPLEAASPLAVGGEATGAVSYLDALDRYTVELEAGQEVAIEASSASGDLGFLLVEPGEPWAEAPAYDGTEDSEIGTGMVEGDARATFEAPVDGRYTVVVFAFDEVSTTYRLTVEAA